MGTTARLVVAVSLALAGAGLAQERRSLGKADVGRIEELFRLTDVCGAKLWPGFDARKIPIAVNCEDRQEMLVGHPDPPPEFSVFSGHELDRRPVMIRDGVTRFGPRSGGWAVDLGGERTAYVSILAAGQTTESYLSLLLHECFHVYQRRYRERAGGPLGELPGDDAVYAAMIGLESRILHALVNEAKAGKARALAGMFVAVRHERRRDLREEVVRTEGEEEFNEGTATYIQARLFQLLAKAGGLKGAAKARDPRYGGFAGAAGEYRRYVARILPPKGRPISFFHAQYNLGMAQGLLLDRFRPRWKKEMREKGMTQFKLVERAFPLSPKKEKRLAAAAKEQFGYGDLLEEQRGLVDARLATIRGYLDAPGRRYRIHHGDLRATFRWKPRGPVYRVPASLLEERDRKVRVTIWAGGMHFEKGDLVLDSKDVPILFRQDYLEWIDPEPAADGSDLAIRFERRENDVYHGLQLTTDGFVLKVGRARIDRAEGIVAIHPLPPD